MFERAGWPDVAPTGGFTPRWSGAAPHFAPWGSDTVGAAPAAAPLADIPSEISLWDAGCAAGRAEALAVQTAELDAELRLCAALERLQPMPPHALADQLSGAVRALLRELVGSATIDEALISDRCAALAQLASDTATATIHAHPDDVPLLMPMAGALALCADPHMQRGEIRLVDGPGEVLIGPYTILDQIDAAAGDAPC